MLLPLRLVQKLSALALALDFVANRFMRVKLNATHALLAARTLHGRL